MENEKKLIDSRGRVRPRAYKSKYKSKFPKYDTGCASDSDAATVSGLTEISDDRPSGCGSNSDAATVSGSAEISGDVISSDVDSNNDDAEATPVIDIACSSDASVQSQDTDMMMSYMNYHNPDIIDELIENVAPQSQWSDLLDNLAEQSPYPTLDDEADAKSEPNLTCADMPIYPGHSMSTSTHLMLTWMYITTSGLTNKQVEGLLELLNMSFLVKNQYYDSYYRFKQYFENIVCPINKHYYCEQCNSPCKSDDVCCNNDLCKKSLVSKQSKPFFITVPLEKQLQNLFARDDFMNGLAYRKNRMKKNVNNIEDIYDGQQYRRLSGEGGILNVENRHNLSLIFNTDGVPIFKSSQSSIWPIFLMINELPYKMRKQRENMLFGGLWYGKSKPFMTTFLSTLHTHLLKLADGVTLLVKEKEIQAKVVILGNSNDLPARASVLNMNQFNGDSSCIKCLQTGVNHRTPAGGNIRVFPYQCENPTGPPRTHELCHEDARQAFLNSQQGNDMACRGFKGPSFLLFCPPNNIVSGTVLDYMHQILLNIFRTLLTLWFTQTHSQEEYSLYKHIDTVNKRVEQIKPPHTTSRLPRGLHELKHFKASEIRTWMLYYLIPCTRDIMQTKFFYHVCALVEAMFFLLSDSISMKDIENAQRSLNYFVYMTPGLYGERYVTLTVHSLVHLPQMVLEMGPLWATSCFIFENANGELLKMFHGTQFVDIQIAKSVNQFQVLPTILQRLEKEAEGHTFAASLMGKSMHINEKTFYPVGSPVERLDLPAGAQDQLIVINDVKYYNRAHIRGLIYHSKSYSRVTARNSYTIMYATRKGIPNFGWVYSYIEYGNEELMCLVEHLNEEPLEIIQNVDDELGPKTNFLRIKLRNIHKVRYSGQYKILAVDDIMALCMCIGFDDELFVIEEPNHQELNL